MGIDLRGLSSVLSKKVSKNVENKRYDHCKDCTFLIKATKQCMKCGCFMKMKVKYSQAFCPIGIWGKDE